MSLFAGFGAPKPAGSSLFPNTQPAPSTGGQTGGSLFGGLNTAKPAGGSLFGSAQPAPTTTGQAGGSLFGGLSSATTAVPATSGGLFGSLSAPKPTNTLFGPATTQPQQTPGAQPLFGQTQPQPQQQNNAQSSLFAPSTASATQGNDLQPSQAQQHSGAYFDSLLEKSRKRTHGATALEELPTLQLGLGDLRQRLRKLGPASQDVSDGRAQYLLAGSGVDIGAAVRDLTYLDGQVNRERPQGNAVQTNDVEGYLATLQTQTTLSMIADGLARSARDFDNFLEENVTMEWDAQRKRIYQHFGLQPREAPRVEKDANGLGDSRIGEGAFGRSRRSKAQPTRGPKAGPSGSVFGKSGMYKSVIGNSGPVGSRQQTPFVDVEKSMEAAGSSISTQDDRMRRDKQFKFSMAVQNLNAARLQQKTCPILHDFAAVEGQLSEEYVEHVVKAYKALIEVTGESPEKQSLSTQGTLKERHFAVAYLDESPGSGKNALINSKIISGACRHLEKQFFHDLEVLIAKNPREANLGGVPNVMSKVRAYIRLKAARKDLAPDDTDLQQLGDDYVWALVYYLLRSGYVTEAVQYVAENNIAFRAIDRNFITYISDYSKRPDRKLKREFQDRINNEYNQRVRIAPEHSIDPFRMACYNIIGRCDLVKRSLDGLYHQMEDWLWLQFVLAREAGKHDENASEAYGLKEVQDTIDTVVNKHAQGATGFGVFFYIQVLAGRFEQAVRFLYTHQYVDAVHFAIALDYYGLLRIAGPTAPEGELMSFSTRGLPQISFARMIGYYTQDFRAANVIAAVDYLALICLNRDLPGEAGQQQAAQCHEALRELVLETREFAQLLGDVQNSGIRIPGAIEDRIKLLGLDDTEEFMRNITAQAASIADDNGRTTDAVLLYHLAAEYDYVTAICNRALSDAIAVEIGQDPMSLAPAKSRPGVPENQRPDDANSPALSLTSCDNPYTLARSVANIYYGKPGYREKINAQTWNTLEVLVNIYNAKELVVAGKFSPALDALAKLEIVPIVYNGAQSDSNYIRQCASKYSSMDQAISRLVPNLIVWTIHSASSLRSALLSGPYASDGGMKKELSTTLSNIAKDLMMYSGFLKYRLPASVNDSLARIAAE